VPHYHDDHDPERYLAKPPPMVQLPCPDCPHVVVALSEKHARELLLIHQEAACQGREEVGGDDDSDPAPAGLRAADVPRLTR
jgi:hypothetical protein